MDDLDLDRRRTCPSCGTRQRALSVNEALGSWLIWGGGLTRYRRRCQACGTGWGYARFYDPSKLPIWRRAYFGLKGRTHTLLLGRRLYPLPISYVFAVLAGVVISGAAAPWLRLWSLGLPLVLPSLLFALSFRGWERR